MNVQIRGGFFWMQTESPILVAGENNRFDNCVVIPRPQWWQVVRWYRAIKLWLAMPYDQNTSAAAITVRGGQ